uniref:Insulin-like growth factor-binding protein n=1 Tax=Hadrurus spadix TaxID=141984 RepID=A0A1W7RAD9_9SCOR
MWNCVLLVGIVGLAAGAKINCPPCHKESCQAPLNCLAGLVKDICDCCYVCGRTEGERCDNLNLALPYGRKYGYCGENLECRMRTDLAPGDPDEGICVCLKQDVLCGSDGNTYDNECKLTEARYKLRDVNYLRAVSRGPCRSAPEIISPPETTVNRTGGSAALSCEVTGWPIPVIEWKVDHGDGIMLPMPSDRPRISVQTRGGPGNYEVTSWLQVQNLELKDHATYWCIARNDEGEMSASAQIRIKNFPRFNEI